MVLYASFNSLLASSVSLTARKRHFNHAGGESDPQSVTLAVYLHADNALVLHAIYTASEREKRGQREKDDTWAFSACFMYLLLRDKKVGKERCKPLNEIYEFI